MKHNQTLVFTGVLTVCFAVVGNEYPLAKARASVPDETMGDPETENPVGADNATDVTVPLPAPDVG